MNNTPPVGQIIAIAGLMGSGKSTLAERLRVELAFENAEESRPALAYLPDLFENQRRWACETQIAFLVDKASNVLSAIRSGRNVILDRTLQEDVEIFARHFADEGWIDSRSFRTYSSTARFFLNQVPPPTITIFCDCDLDEAVRRMRNRDRSHDRSYPPGHIEKIAGRYARWLQGRKGGMWIADTQETDFRDISKVKQVAAEVWQLLRRQAPPQLALPFASDGHQTELFGTPAYAKPLLRQWTTNRLRILNEQHLDFKNQLDGYATRRVYIAAPYSKFEIPTIDNAKSVLPGLVVRSNEIPRGDYRNMLLAVRASTNKLGLSATLPHKDINNWGKRKVSISKLTDECLDAVRRSALFIGLLGDSPGSHLEFGVAAGLGIPRLVIRCPDLGRSALGSGIKHIDSCVRVVQCESFRDIVEYARSDRFRTDIQQLLREGEQFK